MKKRICLLLAIGMVCLSVGCSKRKSETVDRKGTQGPQIPVNSVVCIVDSVKLAADGADAVTVRFGDELQRLKGERADSLQPPLTYWHVRHSSGAEGWIESRAVVAGGRTAAIVDSCRVYAAPDTLQPLAVRLAPMEMIAVTAERDDWLTIVTRNRQCTGFIRDGNLTYDGTDLRVCRLITAACREIDPTLKAQQLRSIVDNEEYGASVFMAKISPLDLNPAGLNADTATAVTGSGTDMTAEE
jgi:hypothetical protein